MTGIAIVRGIKTAMKIVGVGRILVMTDKSPTGTTVIISLETSKTGIKKISMQTMTDGRRTSPHTATVLQSDAARKMRKLATPSRRKPLPQST